MMPCTIIGGPSSIDLAKKISKRLSGKYIESQLKIFPDGERKLTLSDVPKKGKIVVVQSTFQPPDSNLLHAFSLISKAKQYSSEVIAVIPYLAYARQDIEFLKGEIVTSAIIAKLLGSAGASKIIVVDIHSELVLNYFDVSVQNVSAVPKLAEHFKKLMLNKPLVVSPDLFWSAHAKRFASVLNTGSLALNKQRDRKTGSISIIPSKKMNLRGRDVIIVDDMISTGNSVIKATRYLRTQNCGSVYVACTHALLVNDAEKRIKSAGVKKIISTNTVPGKNAVVDISDIIASAI